MICPQESYYSRTGKINKNGCDLCERCICEEMLRKFMFEPLNEKTIQKMEMELETISWPCPFEKKQKFKAMLKDGIVKIAKY
jgi:hypothetical protein